MLLGDNGIRGSQKGLVGRGLATDRTKEKLAKIAKLIDW